MTQNYVNLCWGREERNNPPKKHTERQKERQEKSMLWQSRRRREKTQSLRLRHPPSLPPPSWKHRVRALSLHVLIMINAGSTTHTLKPRFWQGSAVVLCSGLWFCMEQLTLPSGLLKFKNHELVKSQQGGRQCGWEQLCSSQRVLHSTGKGPHQIIKAWCFREHLKKVLYSTAMCLEWTFKVCFPQGHFQKWFFTAP